MELSLSTWQRVALTSVMNAVEGNARTIRMAHKWIDALELTDKEREAAGITVEGGIMRWPQPEASWNVQVPDDKASWDFLRERFMAWQWKAVHHREVMMLANILRIDFDRE